MKKFILPILLFMMFIPYVVNAKSSIIVNNESELANALNSYENNEITLGNDITLSERTIINIKNGEHTLNLENYKLTSNRNYDTVPNGLIDITGGTLIVNGESEGLFEAPRIEQNFYINSGKLIINGGTIMATRSDGADSLNAEGGQVYINGGNIIGSIFASNNSSIVINDGNFNGYNDAAVYINSNVIIKKGKFSAGENIWTYGFDGAIVIYPKDDENIENYENYCTTFLAEGSEIDDNSIFQNNEGDHNYYLTKHTIEITNNEIIKYENEDGTNKQTFEPNKEIILKVKGNYNKFVSLTIDGVKLKKYDDYIISGDDNATIITLNSELIKNNSASFTVRYADESLDSNIIIKTNEDVSNQLKNPNTGTGILLIIIVLLLGISSITYMLLKRKKLFAK